VNHLEAKIRDDLALNLERLEPGLALIAKEYPLQNAIGSGGFIDLLARDRFGHFVVIEVKRSDQSARSALHELTKYMALLRAARGVGREQMRAILVSTDWRELAVPFSEYLKICEVPIEGFVIATDPAGLIRSVTPFEPVETSGPLVMNDLQDLQFFYDAADRMRGITKFADAARRVGISEFVILNADFQGRDARIRDRYALCLILCLPPQAMLGAEVSGDREYLSHDVREADDLLCELHRTMGSLGDDFDAGSPDKLREMEASGWRFSVAHRSGRYTTNEMLFTDEHILREAKKLAIGSSEYIEHIASPKYALSWQALVEGVEKVLMGNEQWATIARNLLKEIAQRSPGATVSVLIFNPRDFVLGLTELFLGRQGYVPSFEIVVSDENDLRVYAGALNWNGEKVAISGQQWVEGLFGSKVNYVRARATGTVWRKDAEAKARLGLTSEVFEITDLSRLGQIFLLRSRGDQLERLKPHSKWMLADFEAANHDFGSSLTRFIGSFTFGLSSLWKGFG
jgi:hypothetical protein